MKRSKPGSRGKFALLCQHFYPEMISTGMHMTELATALAERGWTVEAICAQPSLSTGGNPDAPRRLEYNGVHVTRVRTLGSHTASLPRRMLFAASFAITTTMRVFRIRKQVDGLLITTNPPFIALVGWLFRRVFGLPYVLIVYDVYPDVALRLGLLRERSLLARIWVRATRLMLGGAERVVVIGRDMEEIIRGKLRADRQGRLRLIPNWSDEATVSPVPRERNAFTREHRLAGRFVVQYSGRMGRTHNLEPLLHAADLLRGTPVVFQLIGDGAKHETLVRMAQEMALDNVQFLPYQPMERLGEALSAADLAVVCLDPAFTGVSVPSKTYGVMAAGRPLLALCEERSEIGRTIIDARCGVVLEEATGSTVAEVIESLRDDPMRLSLMGQAGREAFLANFTLSESADRYDLCLAEAFGRPRRRRGRADARDLDASAAA